MNFMFDARRYGNIKNNKIERWKIELGCYEYVIMNRPGKNNIPADTLSRAQCNALNNMGRLQEIHENLCHPGITSLAHFGIFHILLKRLRECVQHAQCVLDRNYASIHQKQDA